MSFYQKTICGFFIIFLISVLYPENSHSRSYYPAIQVTCIPELNYFQAEAIYAPMALEQAVQLKKSKFYREKYNLILPGDAKEFKCKIDDKTLKFKAEYDFDINEPSDTGSATVRIWLDDFLLSEIENFGADSGAYYAPRRVSFTKNKFLKMSRLLVSSNEGLCGGNLYSNTETKFFDKKYFETRDNCKLYDLKN